MFEELARVLDREDGCGEVAESARRLRVYAQTRFQQRVLIDEAARELTLMRETLTAFLWREATGPTGDDMSELRESLQLTNAFIDELLFQTILIYAASSRPILRTRSAVWPPPRGGRPGIAPAG